MIPYYELGKKTSKHYILQDTCNYSLNDDHARDI